MLFENLFIPRTSGNTASVIDDILDMNRKAPVTCNINYTCILENERLIEVTNSHVHCKCGNISEWDRVTVTKKVKASDTRCQALGPELIPVYRQSARR